MVDKMYWVEVDDIGFSYGKSSLDVQWLISSVFT